VSGNIKNFLHKQRNSYNCKNN